MDHVLVAGTDLHGLQPARLIHGRVENKIPVLIGSLGRQQVGLLGFDDQIGLAHLPAFHKIGRGWQVGSCAFHRAAFHPFCDQLNLLVREMKFIGKLKFAGLRKPGRHEFGLRYRGDLSGMRLCILIGEQREWSCFPRTMAARARAKENGRDITVESHLLIRCRNLVLWFGSRMTLQDQSNCQKKEKHARAKSLYRACHLRSEMKQPTPSAAADGGATPLLAASMASANSCVVAARRVLPNSRYRSSIRP